MKRRETTVAHVSTNKASAVGSPEFDSASSIMACSHASHTVGRGSIKASSLGSEHGKVIDARTGVFEAFSAWMQLGDEATSCPFRWLRHCNISAMHRINKPAGTPCAGSGDITSSVNRELFDEGPAAHCRWIASHSAATHALMMAAPRSQMSDSETDAFRSNRKSAARKRFHCERETCK